MRSLLTEECALVMPPWAEWFDGRDAVIEFLPRGPLKPGLPWKLMPTRASGQPALACYRGDDGSWQAEGILVLTLSAGGRIDEITTFRDPGLLPSFGLPREMNRDE